jgi:hypothetical protein
VIISGFKAWASRGYVRVFSGATSALLHHVEGDASASWFGVGVAGFGDVDGDGFGEFAVTAFRDSQNGHEAGLVRVYSGRSGAVMATMYGVSSADWFGYALASSADMDGDGKGELIVGTNQDGTNGFLSGSVSVFSGKVFGTVQLFCFGDGSGTACPCGNTSVPGLDQGCANSTGGGGMLHASGIASVANDTFSLSTSGLPPSASALFFQGNAKQSGGAGAVFGDGLRCVTSGVFRIGVRQCTNGATLVPGINGVPVSIAGVVPLARRNASLSGLVPQRRRSVRQRLQPHERRAVTASWAP